MKCGTEAEIRMLPEIHKIKLMVDLIWDNRFISHIRDYNRIQIVYVLRV